MMKWTEDEVREHIKKVGFYNNKAKFLKKATQIIVEEHKGQVPDDLESLVALPGVGHKMANIAL